MLSIISLFDDRARPKGSRDPLGIEAVWTFMGRTVVGNLTTVTSNLENFIIALLCCYYANSNWTKLDQVQEQFMRAEQLAAYLKLINAGHLELTGFLGITRASKNVEEDKMFLGIVPEAQILSDQLSYGLWGLYSSAMVGAGLISGMERKPTDRGKELILAIINHLGNDQWAEFQRLSPRSRVSSSEINHLSERFGSMLVSTEIRQIMVNALISKQNNCDLQSELYACANKYLENTGDIEGSTAQIFCNWLLGCNDVDSGLKEAIERINDIEPLLVIANTVMSWLQSQKNQNVSELERILVSRLSDIQCKASWQQTSIPHYHFLENLFSAINKANAAEIITILVKQNKDIMLQRGGAAWLEIDGQQRLKVRVLDDKDSLPKDLNSHSQKWQNNYFIGSFLNIIKQGKSWRR